MTTPNPFIEVHRARRVRMLVEYFDRFLDAAGLDPKADARAMVVSLTDMKEPIWNAHAVAAGLGERPPSKVTIGRVIAEYAARAAALPEVAESLIADQDPWARFAS